MGKNKQLKQQKQKAISWVNLSRIPRIGNIIRRLTVVAAITTNASGFASAVINSTYLRANATEWSSCAALYTEYRIIRTRMHVCPQLPAASTAGTNFAGPIIFYCDRSGASAALASLTAAFAYDTSKPFNFWQTTPKPIKYDTQAIDLEEQNFTSTGVNSTTFSVGYVFSDPSAASVTVGSLLIEWLVEFKGNM